MVLGHHNRDLKVAKRETYALKTWPSPIHSG